MPLKAVMEKVHQTKFSQRVVLALFAIAVLAVWSPVLRNGFINFDDPPYVTENLHVLQGLTLQGVEWAFTSFHSYNWHPLTWLSHMADVSLYGQSPAGHHLTSVLLHVVDALLLFAFLFRFSKRWWESFLVAVLFAVHPTRVESVAWVAERKDVLSTFFLFLSLWLYGGYREDGGKGRYFAVLAAFAAGLMAKPMLVTLPLLLLLMDFLPLAESTMAVLTGRSRLLAEKVPFLAIAGLSALITVAAQAGGGAVLYESPLWLNTGNAAISYARYLGMMVWPQGLAVLYPFRPDAVNVLNVSAAVAVIVALSALAVWQLHRRPYILWGWLWYLVTLVPVIGLVRIGRHAIADRYTYVPYVGLFVIVVWGGAELARSLKIPRPAVVAAAVVAVVALVAVTVRQQGYWQSSITLFERTLDVTADNALAHKNLGLAYGARGDAAAAAREGALGRMLENREISYLYPENPDVRYRLGSSLLDVGQYREAAGEFRKVIGLKPEYAAAYNGLGIALARMGMVVEARDAFSQAVRLDPGNQEAAFNLQQVNRPGTAVQ